MMHTGEVFSDDEEGCENPCSGERSYSRLRPPPSCPPVPFRFPPPPEDRSSTRKGMRRNASPEARARATAPCKLRVSAPRDRCLARARVLAFAACARAARRMRARELASLAPPLAVRAVALARGSARRSAASQSGSTPMVRPCTPRRCASHMPARAPLEELARDRHTLVRDGTGTLISHQAQSGRNNTAVAVNCNKYPWLIYPL